MALPGFSAQEELDLYFLIRNIMWRLRLDEAEAVLASDIRRVLTEAMAEMERSLIRIDPARLTPEAVATVMADIRVASGENKGRVSLRDAVVESIAAAVGIALINSLREQGDIISIGGAAKNVHPIAMAEATPQSLAALFRNTPLNGRTLTQWVDKAIEAGFEGVIRAMDEGVSRGETYRNLARRIMREVTGATEREAVLLARTYVQSVAVAAQEAQYEANADIIAWLEWSAVLEPGYKQTGRGTCIRCAALDGMRWRVMDRNRPDMPLHLACRCCWIPIMDWEKLGISERALDERVRPYTLRPDENIATGGGRAILEAGRARGSWGEWAQSRDEAFKINAVGPRRYALWKASGLDFATFAHAMVDRNTGELYTLAQLERRLRGGSAYILGGGEGSKGGLPPESALRLLEKSVAESASRGFHVPESIVIAEKGSMPLRAPASYNYAIDALRLNGEYDFSKLAERAEANRARNWWSTGSPQHVFRHELGHAATYGNNPRKYAIFSNALRDGELPVPKTIQAKVIEDVSKYAAISPREFTAEVYAGLMDGKTYDDKIMRLYRAYGGDWR